jgi:hypothetical protein
MNADSNEAARKPLRDGNHHDAAGASVMALSRRTHKSSRRGETFRLLSAKKFAFTGEN